MTQRKIIVAMSGGVDSSVAAALLAREGHEVIGVTMRLLKGGATGFGCCGAPEDLLIAKRAAEKIGIPHYVLDFSNEFEEKVVDYFVGSYLAGETPNPCLACNRHIKFSRLKNFATSLGATHIATGHYARIEEEADGTRRLFESADAAKDQSYVLYNFDQDGLAATLFPVGGTPKPMVRELARDFHLPNAGKKDSQEICFVPNRDYRAFVREKVADAGAPPATARPGPIVDDSGRVVGEHQGVAFYTVGQRSGVGGGSEGPRYVSKLDPETNTVVIGPDQSNLSGGLVADDVNWVAERPAASFEALVKIRYRHEPAPATIEPSAGGFQVRFKEPQRAVSPGQAAVVYRWDARREAREVLGGGKITAALSQ
ncbi:MAG: tRNA 2-thiouridine(34) synthase MnmA [Elusimicrobia bacterium]|nr:tRNA 2-thiouridine(34) synthase MnmA [Elusimicrobiota bacterium]